MPGYAIILYYVMHYTTEIDARMLTSLPAVITCVLEQAIDYDDNTHDEINGHRKLSHSAYYCNPQSLL